MSGLLARPEAPTETGQPFGAAIYVSLGKSDPNFGEGTIGRSSPNCAGVIYKPTFHSNNLVYVVQ